MVRVPLAVGTWAVPWYDRPSRVAEPATMTDVAVDASTPVGPTVVLDLDWLPEASVPGCEELPGLDPGVAPGARAGRGRLGGGGRATAENMRCAGLSQSSSPQAISSAPSSTPKTPPMPM